MIEENEAEERGIFEVLYWWVHFIVHRSTPINEKHQEQEEGAMGKSTHYACLNL